MKGEGRSRRAGCDVNAWMVDVVSFIDVHSEKEITHSATSGASRDIVDVSTVKRTALVAGRYSWNWARSRGWPGTSTMRAHFLGDMEKAEMLVCIEV